MIHILDRNSVPLKFDPSGVFLKRLVTSYKCVYLSINLSLYLSIDLCTYFLSMYLFIFLTISLSISLTIHQSISFSYLSIYLSIYLYRAPGQVRAVLQSAGQVEQLSRYRGQLSESIYLGLRFHHKSPAKLNVFKYHGQVNQSIQQFLPNCLETGDFFQLGHSCNYLIQERRSHDCKI